MRFVVSACLAGLPCRYDGRAAPYAAVIALVRNGQALAVCPEQLGGLPTPREASELRYGKVLTSRGEDVTEAFMTGAIKALRLTRAAGCTEAVLKARSPSCGCGWIYDGSFSGRLVSGDGLFAALARQAGLQLWTEEQVARALTPKVPLSAIRFNHL